MLLDYFKANCINLYSEIYRGCSYIEIGVAIRIRIRIRNPNPTPFLDKKHNPNPHLNPQFKLRIRIVVFLKTFVAFLKKSTYKILIIINNLISCNFF